MFCLSNDEGENNVIFNTTEFLKSKHKIDRQTSILNLSLDTEMAIILFSDVSQLGYFFTIIPFFGLSLVFHHGHL